MKRSKRRSRRRRNFDGFAPPYSDGDLDIDVTDRSGRYNSYPSGDIDIDVTDRGRGYPRFSFDDDDGDIDMDVSVRRGTTPPREFRIPTPTLTPTPIPTRPRNYNMYTPSAPVRRRN